MAGADTLLEFISGVALLLWATAVLRRSVDRAAGARIRAAIGEAVRGRVRASAIGAVTAVCLQSSSATGLLVAAFTQKGIVPLAAALALMLGADLGSSLVVLVLSVQLGTAANLLLVIGAFTALGASRAVWRAVGRALVGVALILLSLKMIVAVATSLRETEAFIVVMRSVDAAPLVAFLLGGVLAWMVHSSVAIVLLAVSFASAGVATEVSGMAFILGANLGSGFVPAIAGFRIGDQARRVLIGNIVFRAAGACAALALLLVAEPMRHFGADPARALMLGHIVFNLSLAILFLPFIEQVARWLGSFIAGEDDAHGQLHSNLRAIDLERPELAMQAARREVMKLADTVEFMLSEVLTTFRDDDASRRQTIKSLDDDVDRLQHDIKLYLSRLLRSELSKAQKRECHELLSFTTKLKHVGGIIDNGLLKLAKKRQRSGVRFSEMGWGEIQALHARTVAHMRLAVSVYATGDLELAKELIAGKEQIQRTGRKSVKRHFERLMAGQQASVETSDIHLDVLRDLKRIIAYLTAVCYPILERHGALRPSRLRAR